MKKLIPVVIVVGLVVGVIGGYAYYKDKKKRDILKCKLYLKQIGLKYLESGDDASVLKNKKCPITAVPYLFHEDWFKKRGIALTCFEHKKDSAGRQEGFSLHTDGSVK